MPRNAALYLPSQLKQLAVMIDAGIPIDTALTSLKSRSVKENKKLERTISLVKHGVSLPEAFQRSNLINKFDYAMLASADNAGCLPNGLNHISENKIRQLQRIESLKVSLIFPKAIMFIGAMAGIFVRMASDQQSLVEAIVSIGLVVGCFYLVCIACLFVARADARIWMSWAWSHPLIYKNCFWCRCALEHQFYTCLIWQMAAGVTPSDAAKACGDLFDSRSFQLSAKSASDAMAGGESLTTALVNGGLVLTDRMRQVLLIADQSGLHETAIKHELELQSQVLNQKAEIFFKWLPRVFYVLALALISKFIFV